MWLQCNMNGPFSCMMSPRSRNPFKALTLCISPRQKWSHTAFTQSVTEWKLCRQTVSRKRAAVTFGSESPERTFKRFREHSAPFCDNQVELQLSTILNYSHFPGYYANGRLRTDNGSLVKPKLEKASRSKCSTRIIWLSKAGLTARCKLPITRTPPLSVHE